MENKKTKEILLNVDYSGKGYWQESTIKNKIFVLDGDIHETIKSALEDNDYVEMSYNGKPQSFIYRDKENGQTEKVGYVYRVKSEIDDKKINFDAWVTIKEVSDFDFPKDDNIV